MKFNNRAGLQKANERGRTKIIRSPRGRGQSGRTDTPPIGGVRVRVLVDVRSYNLSGPYALCDQIGYSGEDLRAGQPERGCGPYKE